MRKVTKIEGNVGSVVKKPKLRVAAYARVSTDSDEQLTSLEAQKTHYESLIKANQDWEFVGIYYDEGISGTKKDKRKELLRLISDCEHKEIDFIVTKSISRLARNTVDCLSLVRKLTDLGIHIHFEKEDINTKSMDSELMLTILSSLAENESISTSKNNTWAIQKRFRNGTYKVASPPYGYDNTDGDLVVNIEKAEVVKRIFADALSGKGAIAIAEGLNADGIHSKRGGEWSGSTIRFILGNEAYTGDLLLQKTYTDENFVRHQNKGERDQYFIENHHEAIISHEEFDAAQKALKQRGKEKGTTEGSSKYYNRYPFSGLITCSECGSTFKRRIHSSAGKKYIAWCCSKHLSSADECSMLFVRDERIKMAFVTMMNKLIFSRKFVLKPMLQGLKAANYADSQGRVKDIQSKIEENAEQVKVLVELMTKGYLEPALFNKLKNELATEAAGLRERKAFLCRSIDGGVNVLMGTKKLLKFVSKAKTIEDFDDDLFEEFIDGIIVYSPVQIGFRLKCGLTLRERMER